MSDFKFTTTFSSIIKSVIPEEKDKYLAMASLADIGAYIPDVDVNKNIDLLPVAFNAFVANRANKNGDVVDSKTAIEIARAFTNKPINIEHNRTRVIGVILIAGYSEFGTDKPIPEDQVMATKAPFNVALGGVIWKVVNSNIADKLEEASDPTSDDYLSISASWELGFSDFDLALTVGDEKNLENAEIIDDDDQIDELKSHLRALGGEGVTEDGQNIYRKVIGDIVPLGIGLTATPAADVKGVFVQPDTEKIKLVKNVKSEENKEEKEISEKTQNKSKTNPNKENNISHSKENNVKQIKDTSIMKIEKLSDITNESLKEIEASAISDFIEEELKKASDEYLEKKTKVETALKAAEEKSEALVKDQEELKTNLTSVSEELDSLKADQIEREKQELFSQRMSSLDEKYALTDEDREVIASDIKELNEEAYSAWESKMSVLLSSKEKQEEAVAAAEFDHEAFAPPGVGYGPEMKKLFALINGDKDLLAFVKALMPRSRNNSYAGADETETPKLATEGQKAKEQVEEKRADETKAEEPVNTAEEIVDEAIEAAEETTESVPVTSEASEPNVYDKYKNAFSMEGFEIKL